MLYWILVGAFPAKKTFECLKKPVKGETRHWCIFWTLFAALRCFDPILSFIPFFSAFSTLLLISNYNQHLSELTLKGGLGLFRYSQLKIKNHDMTSKIMDKGQKFYKSNYKILNKVKTVFDTVISTISSLNEGISNFSSQTLLQNLQSTQTMQGVVALDTIIVDSDEQNPGLSNRNKDRRIRSSPDLSSPVITLKSNLNNINATKATSALPAVPAGSTLGNLASYITSAIPYGIKEKEKEKEEDSFTLTFDD